MKTILHMTAILVAVGYIGLCVQIIVDDPGETIWPWTKQPVPVDMDVLDEIIGSACRGEIIVIKSDGTMYRVIEPFGVPIGTPPIVVPVNTINLNTPGLTLIGLGDHPDLIIKHDVAK